MKLIYLKSLLLIGFLFTHTHSKAQWTLQTDSLPASSGIKGICIIDANTVWALGYNGAQPAKQTLLKVKIALSLTTTFESLKL